MRCQSKLLRQSFSSITLPDSPPSRTPAADVRSSSPSAFFGWWHDEHLALRTASARDSKYASCGSAPLTWCDPNDKSTQTCQASPVATERGLLGCVDQSQNGGNVSTRLNAGTLEFIRGGNDAGDESGGRINQGAREKLGCAERVAQIGAEHHEDDS